MIEKKHIEQIVSSYLKGTDKFVVDVMVKPTNKIFVFVDSDSKLTIDDCADISRHIESKLDRNYEDFELNVSSAGVDHPFKSLRQYKKHLGKQIQVILKSGIKKQGILENYDKKQIIIQIPSRKKGKPLSVKSEIITFDDIKATKGVITFN